MSVVAASVSVESWIPLVCSPLTLLYVEETSERNPTGRSWITWVSLLGQSYRHIPLNDCRWNSFSCGSPCLQTGYRMTTTSDGSRSSFYVSCLDELHLFLQAATEWRGVVHALREMTSPYFEPQLTDSSRLQLSEWVSEQCFTSPPTQYRLYGRRFLQVKRHNQQYQSTEGRSTKDKENNENN